MHIRDISSMFFGGDSIPHSLLLPSCIVSEKKCLFINSDIMAVTHINLVAREMLGSSASPCLLCCSTVRIIVLINHKHAVICHTLIRSGADSRSNSLWDL